MLLRELTPVQPAPLGPHFSNAEKMAMQRAMVNLAERWGLTNEQAAILLGGISTRTFGRWKSQEFGDVGPDLAARYAKGPLVRWPKKHVIWPKYFRLINSAFPTIDLFEDIAGPSDWLLLGSAESKTNPRVADTIGNLDLIPPTRRVRGDGATYVMTPFTHISPDWAGRFHDGTFGAFYGADSFETALAETMYHTAKFCAATEEKPGWIADKRELIGRIDAELIDICDGYNVLLDEADYAASQAFAR